jgi:hypothetical protein
MTTAVSTRLTLDHAFRTTDDINMLRSVAIKYHQVKENGNDFPIPQTDLCAAFLSAGIDLQLIEGEVLKTDPGVSLNRTYSDLIQEYSKIDKKCGHLIIGVSRADKRKDIAGELHDLASRGVASVYTLSEHIQRDPVASFAQTVAHEIGHMLNLSHGDVTAKFDSTMNSLAQRDQRPELSWERAREEARNMRQAGAEPLYIEPSARTACFPFAFKARQALRDTSDSRLQPWGSPFEHAADQTNLCSCIAWLPSLTMGKDSGRE